MANKDEWDIFYSNIMAFAGVMLGAAGLMVGVYALTRPLPGAVSGVAGREPISGVSVYTPKVHYENGQVLVEVRNPGEWHDIQDFVQPTSPDIVSTINRVLYG